jgi:hypothetical protein
MAGVTYALRWIVAACVLIPVAAEFGIGFAGGQEQLVSERPGRPAVERIEI